MKKEDLAGEVGEKMGGKRGRKVTKARVRYTFLECAAIGKTQITSLHGQTDGTIVWG